MSSGFISEAELAEQRKAKQEEWERVRTAEEPLGNLNLLRLIKCFFFFFILMMAKKFIFKFTY